MSEPTPAEQTRDATSEEDEADRQRFVRLVGTLMGTSLVAMALLVLLRSPGVLGLVVVALGALFLSKLAILGGGLDGNPFGPWELAALSSLLDLWLSCAALAGVAGLEHLPLVGRLLRDARARAEAALRRYPGLRRLAVWGVGLLVFLPLPGSGSVTGSFVGRLVGLSRPQTFGAVAVGAVFACVVYAAVATLLDRHGRAMLEAPWATALAAALGRGGGAVGWLRVRRILEAP
jgi:uncharacterized membrane protein